MILEWLRKICAEVNPPIKPEFPSVLNLDAGTVVGEASLSRSEIMYSRYLIFNAVGASFKTVVHILSRKSFDSNISDDFDPEEERKFDPDNR